VGGTGADHVILEKKGRLDDLLGSDFSEERSELDPMPQRPRVHLDGVPLPLVRRGCNPQANFNPHARKSTTLRTWRYRV
jgi:hypothetical protein